MKKQGKKILVGVLIAIILGGVIRLGMVLTYSKEQGINNASRKQEVSSNEINQNVTEKNTIQEDPIEEQQKISEEKIQEDNAEIPIINGDVDSTKNNITQKVISKNNQKSNVETSTKVETKTNENKNSETTVEKKQEEPKKEQNEVPKVVEQPKQEQPKQDVHTYKYNSSIVEKIKQDIKNNESEYMKKYGYNIVVDESIVTQTNQFTYTGNRVKDKILYKFGTIKIYARDYYLNGNYMYTECYLI